VKHVKMITDTQFSEAMKVFSNASHDAFAPLSPREYTAERVHKKRFWHKRVTITIVGVDQNEVEKTYVGEDYVWKWPVPQIQRIARILLNWLVRTGTRNWR